MVSFQNSAGECKRMRSAKNPVSPKCTNLKISDRGTPAEWLDV